MAAVNVAVILFPFVNGLYGHSLCRIYTITALSAFWKPKLKNFPTFFGTCSFSLYFSMKNDGKSSFQRSKRTTETLLFPILSLKGGKSLMKKYRFVKSLAVAGLALLTLTSCADISMNMVLNEDGTGTASATVEVQRSAVEALGYNSDEFLEQMLSENEPSPTTEITPIQTEETVGFETTSSGTWEEAGTLADGSASITHEDGTLTVRLPMEKALESADLAMMKTMLDSFNISVAFPGEVTSASHNGMVEGNTVTWDLDSVLSAAESGDALTAVGGDSEFNLWYWVGFAAAVLAALLVVLAIVILIIRNQKKKKTATPPAAPSVISAYSSEPSSSFTFAEPVDSSQPHQTPPPSYSMTARPESTIPGAFNLPTQARRNGNRFQ